MSKIILGINCSISCPTYGLIAIDNGTYSYINSGAIDIGDNYLMPVRLNIIVTEIEKIIEQYKPSMVSLEEGFINTNSPAFLRSCYTRGSIMCMVGRLKLKFSEFKPNVVRRSISGDGHADNANILKSVFVKIINCPTTLTDTEALALAIAYNGGRGETQINNNITGFSTTYLRKQLKNRKII